MAPALPGNVCLFYFTSFKDRCPRQTSAESQLRNVTSQTFSLSVLGRLESPDPNEAATTNQGYWKADGRFAPPLK